MTTGLRRAGRNTWLRAVLGVAMSVAAVPAVFADAEARQRHADMRALARGNTAFTVDLYARLRDKPGNLFMSPYSISSALAMAWAGARGETAEQMAETLAFKLPADRIHETYGALNDRLNDGGKEGDDALVVANALWAQQGRTFLEPFTGTLKVHYDAPMREVDFAGDIDKARETINQWVEQKTRDKIRDLFKPGTLPAMTRLALVNAIYFKGGWRDPFKPAETRKQPFTRADGSTVQTPLMHQTKRFGYHEEPGVQLLTMAYRGRGLALTVVLPRTADGLPAIEGKLSAETLDTWLKSARARKVRVCLPKFKITAEFSLADQLSAMGMPLAFSPRADFSGMTGRRDLCIGTVVHKAFVDVNEKGTEAAAATGVGMVATAVQPPSPPVEFRADHPFLFVIHDRSTSSILFIGRLADPTVGG